ncbi:Permease of the drug/metabolite transporter (DMT) superfamily protein [Paeniglutamicibacter gangotriensis Lz1y]|uniref:Permease of the drug/metabolite transporter (DMT) superfamily protein n=2 Tax=Paeniglutamicibacter gangotriensis TaxID=254787 RepID=M7N9Q3_9MICC|nr:Permease of the drug/metabolite transporter (DMT) superfamily protein [Paeniglutamicibacter gangotriensis Lz1y]
MSGPHGTLVGMSAPTPTPVAQRRRPSGLLLVALAGIAWGTIGPAVQLAHQASGLSPSMLGSYRAAAAAFVLLVAAAVAGRLRECWVLGRVHARPALAVGSLTAAFQFFFFLAVVWAGVSVGTVIALGLAPMLLLVLKALRSRAFPRLGELATVAVALTGLLLVSLAGTEVSAAPHPVPGIIAALISGTAFALATDAAVPLSRVLDPFALTVITMIVAAACLVPAGLVVAWVNAEPLGTTDTGSWLMIIYLGVVTMALAYGLLYAGLRTTSSANAVVATLLEPATAVLIAVLFLGDKPTVASSIGFFLIIAAIATLGRRPKRPVADGTPDEVIVPGSD